MSDTGESTFGEARRLIAASGMSINKLAVATGIHRATLMRWMSASEEHAPSGRSLDKLRRFVNDGQAAKALRGDAAVILTQMPNGRARLQVNTVTSYPLALKVLTMLQEGGE